MGDPKEIEAIEAELARDCSRFNEIEELEAQLLDKPQHDGFSDAAEGIRLHSEKELLDRRILRNKMRLVDAKK